jgi:hypothetical protein
MFASYGRDRVERGKARMQPLVTQLVERAQRDGKLRQTCGPPTSCSSSSCSARRPLRRAGQAGTLARDLALITDALRLTARALTPLPEPALEPHQMLAVMRAIPRRQH